MMHAHLVLGDLEVAGEFAAHAERPLRAGPDRELVALPLGDRGARLERHVRDVGDVVRRQLRARGRAVLRRLLEVRVHVAAGGLAPATASIPP